MPAPLNKSLGIQDVDVHVSPADLQHRSEIADAKLGVAEELAWAVALLAAAAAYLQWHNWLYALGLGAVAYYLATFRYRREASTAEDQYFRAAGLGKYAGHPKDYDA